MSNLKSDSSGTPTEQDLARVNWLSPTQARVAQIANEERCCFCQYADATSSRTGMRCDRWGWATAFNGTCDAWSQPLPRLIDCESQNTWSGW